MQEIPKVLHQIWVGPGQLPASASAFTASWQRHHPDWQMHLWTDENIPQPLFNQTIYDQTRIPAQRADILRHELLYRFGGVYVDIDFECLRSLDSLLQGVTYFFGEELPGRPGLAILGSSPGHPFTRWCMKLIPGRFPWQRGRILEETGPDFYARAIKSYSDGCSRQAFADPSTGREAGCALAPPGRPALHMFHPWVFYPYYLGAKWVPSDHPDAYAVHHWQKNWDW